MVARFSILLLILFQSSVLVDFSSNCKHHACLRIHPCKYRGSIQTYFQIEYGSVDYDLGSGCSKNYVSFVFDHQTPSLWKIEMTKNDSAQPGGHRMPTNFTLSYGQILRLKPNEISLNGTSYQMQQIYHKPKAYFESVEGIWRAEIGFNGSLFESIDWSRPRMNLTIMIEHDYMLCKEISDWRGWDEHPKGDEFCEVELSVGGDFQFRQQLNDECAGLRRRKVDSIAMTLMFVNDDNCSLSQIEDFCGTQKDCQQITIADGLLKCDSQLWLKEESDLWLKIDGGICGTNGRISLYRNIRILSNSANPVLQCSETVPTCDNDLYLQFIILIAYSSVISLVIVALFLVLYRSLDKSVVAKRHGAPLSSLVEYDSNTESRKPTRVQKMIKIPEKREEKAPPVDVTKPADDGHYENLTIR